MTGPVPGGMYDRFTRFLCWLSAQTEQCPDCRHHLARPYSCTCPNVTGLCPCKTRDPLADFEAKERNR